MAKTTDGMDVEAGMPATLPCDPPRRSTRLRIHCLAKALTVVGIMVSLPSAVTCQSTNRVTPDGMQRSDQNALVRNADAEVPQVVAGAERNQPPSTASSAADGLLDREAAKMAAEDQQRSADALQSTPSPPRNRDRYRDNPMLSRRRW